MKRNLLAGHWVDSSRAITVTNPHNDEVIAEVALASDDQVEKAIAQTEGAMQATAQLPTWKRIEILQNIARGIETEADGLAKTLSDEACKPIDFAKGEIGRAISTFEIAAEELRCERHETMAIDAVRGGKNKWGVSRPFPVGPVAAITPFNFPLNLVAHKVAPAIATGCPIVVKPADKTPLSALALGKIILDSDWPENALSVLNTDLANAGRLSADPRFKLLSFTGSDRVGWLLKSQAGKKRVILELGGDGAVIVEPDVTDLAAVAARIAYGAFAYAGQVCISVQRVWAHHSVYGDLLDAVLAAIKEKVKTGPPHEPGVNMSSMIDDAAVEKTESIIQQTIDAGATLHCGGSRQHRLFEPMLLTDVPPTSPLANEELFGPALYLAPYRDFDEAIASVNNSRFGLQAGLYTSNWNRIQQAFSEIEVGALLINEIPMFRADHMPYGGVKDSGLGREGLRYAMAEYREEKLMILPAR